MDTIKGGSIATDGVVKLTIDSDKIGYIFLPNGSILTTVAGVIDTTYKGFGGAITYYVPKVLTNQINTRQATYTGTITYNGTNAWSCGGNAFMTGCVAPNAQILEPNNSSKLTTLIAPKVVKLAASDCALTAKSIGDILYQAYSNNRANVVFNFTGGTNAINTAISGYLTDTYGVDLFTVETALVANGGTVTYRT